MRRLLFATLLAACALAFADDHLVSIATRPGVKVGYWWMPREGATATIGILPGGSGGIGYVNGQIKSQNFLVRTRDLWADEHFNIALIGKPSDVNDMEVGFRSSAEHIEDLRLVVEKLRRDGGKPVWLVGTSRGTVSAAAAAAALDPSLIAGVVLTSSVTNDRHFRAVPALPLSDIRVPVLVMHHKRDACRSCDPSQTGMIMWGLRNAPVKKLVLVDGGGGASGDPCEALHYHGYIGMEPEAVHMIAEWIRDPKS